MEEDGDPWMQVPKFVRPGICPFLEGDGCQTSLASLASPNTHHFIHSFIYSFMSSSLGPIVLPQRVTVLMVKVH